ncbi:MAG TPA: hypothetical protein DCM30_04535 [Acinetobacter radioresistens]|nr:hypothetical protein [Acinetobacter radioresistens]
MLLNQVKLNNLSLTKKKQFFGTAFFYTNFILISHLSVSIFTFNYSLFISGQFKIFTLIFILNL